MKRKRKNKSTAPESTKKMSEILLDYAWNYAVKDQSDPMQRQHFMNVACSAWNFSLLSEDDCRRAIVSFIENIRDCNDQFDEANMKALENDMLALIAWKNERYSTIRNLVVSAELYDDGDNIGCKATFGDYETLVRAKLVK